MNASTRITVVNHNTVDIDRPAEVVWQDILETYVDGRKFSSQGYVVASIEEDPGAYLGGYRMTLHGKDGNLVDDRICRITERDDAAMRLSLCAEYLVPPEMNLIVNASYAASPTPGGSRYTLDAYSMMNVALPKSAAEPSSKQVAEQFQSQSSSYLDAFLTSVKERLESSKRDSR